MLAIVDIKGVDESDYTDEVAELLSTIGMGIYWSEELHTKAKVLAATVQVELDKVYISRNTETENTFPRDYEK